MCGIAGEVAFAARGDRNGITELVHRIRHRGPDDFGIWASPEAECVLGHARLSIIDLSPLGHQPMVDHETGNCISFNGEIYNYQELRRDLEAAGEKFRSSSDTEVLLLLYRRHGVSCLSKLRGMFSFAIWDEGKKRLFLARDRVGKKPLNYALLGGRLVFCSEIDPLARHPAVSREMDVDALELYLQLQYVPPPWSIYKQIRKLPPAHYGLFDSNGLSIERYWNVDYRRKIVVSEQDALDGLEEKLTEAVRLRMIADVPLGALLSGGVDSSVIVALMSGLSGAPVQTYSIGFDEQAYNELPFAKQAAEICRTSHHPEIVHGDVEHLLPRIVRHYGEPFADSSAVPSFLVCETARRHVTVALNGDGGDELLGGYPRYWLSPAQIGIASAVPDCISPRSLASLSARFASVSSIPGRALRKLVTEYAWPELRSVGMYSGFWDDVLRAQLLPKKAVSTTLPRWRASWLEGAQRYAQNAVDRMLWYDNRTYLSGDLLVKMDIASMHCGLEMRSPLLDHEVIEYCAALPVDLKVKGGIGKYLLKRLAERHFPPEFVHRPKMGFGIPLENWLRGPLRPLLLDTLHNRDAMAPLEHSVIENTLNDFLARKGDHGSRIWALLMFGVWRKEAHRSQ